MRRELRSQDFLGTVRNIKYEFSTKIYKICVYDKALKSFMQIFESLYPVKPFITLRPPHHIFRLKWLALPPLFLLPGLLKLANHKRAQPMGNDTVTTCIRI